MVIYFMAPIRGEFLGEKRANRLRGGRRVFVHGERGARGEPGAAGVPFGFESPFDFHPRVDLVSFQLGRRPATIPKA